MIREICRDTFFLSQRSEEAGAADMQTAADLQETLRAHAGECVGMAANMIGVRKRIIAVMLGMSPVVMMNPEIVARSGEYETQEGCLSLSGVRSTVRYRRITVVWQDMRMQKQKRSFEGFPAQIIQHEIDHLNGILI
ncbi:MAG: peptide deformylase [Oscillospiraceae bacterium]|nr:peptide deformylase [Oscillospiraceae bacterium]